MRFSSLNDWLTWQETLHPRAIDLRLDRLNRTLERLRYQRPSVPVITVGGTNGKGSCVALLASIYRATGYRVGTFTSPHLVRYNERITVDGAEVSDESLIAAFERIDAARADDTLTYFEFNTLAAFLIFETARPDVIVLEVGMGGRLDSVNVIDPDVAIVASISLDHLEWLGPDVESIGREKAGIFRKGRPAIYGSFVMPDSIAVAAGATGATLLRLGAGFGFERGSDGWSWRMGLTQLDDLPAPGLAGDIQYENSSAVLAAVHLLQARLPVSFGQIAAGLREVALSGRFEEVRGPVTWIFDVAHNPAAAATLAQRLDARPIEGRTIAVCGMLADKDIDGVIAAVGSRIDAWIVSAVSSSRGIDVNVLAERVKRHGGTALYAAESVTSACEYANDVTRAGERIVVFGSFTTVGPALEWVRARG
jgi:dihydrofolate synthase / folylpolyglutamate synthase